MRLLVAPGSGAEGQVDDLRPRWPTPVLTGGRGTTRRSPRRCRGPGKTSRWRSAPLGGPTRPRRSRAPAGDSSTGVGPVVVPGFLLRRPGLDVVLPGAGWPVPTREPTVHYGHDHPVAVACSARVSSSPSGGRGRRRGPSPTAPDRTTRGSASPRSPRASGPRGGADVFERFVGVDVIAGGGRQRAWQLGDLASSTSGGHGSRGGGTCRPSWLATRSKASTWPASLPDQQLSAR